MSVRNNCDPLDQPPNICPTQDQIFEKICGELPRGKAWQTHSDGDVPREISVLQKFWYAIAGVLEFVNTRICDMQNEMFCETVLEYKDQADIDWGIPDECGLSIGLCEKIKLLGDSSCEYYTSLAALKGFTIICTQYVAEPCTDCGNGSADLMRFGHTSFCGPSIGYANVLNIDVDVDAPPEEPCVGLAVFGLTALGCPGSCEQLPKVPDELLCLLENIVPAHQQINVTSV